MYCLIPGGQSDQGYDSLSKEEVRLGGGEEQNSSPDMKEKKDRNSFPREWHRMLLSPNINRVHYGILLYYSFYRIWVKSKIISWFPQNY